MSANAEPQAAPVVIRAATPNDWNDVAALLGATALLLDGAREHIADFVVAERDGAIVGCAAVERYGEAGLLRSVAVTPAERGNGTGSALVSRCLEEAKRAGLRSVVLLTTTAPMYFPRFGFETIERASVPEAVQDSVEFRAVCCSSAAVMRVSLDQVTD
jgi:amino-acid N-acetyltransferase